MPYDAVLTQPRCSRRQLKQHALLTAEDFNEITKCRRPQNRLGFACQVSFVRLLNRFPAQQPFEVVDDLVTFSAVQIGVDAGLIDLYRRRRQTISEHQQAIIEHLKLRHFGDAEAVGLEQFVFEQSCRLERTVALQARAKEFLKEQRILEPAESRIAERPGGAGERDRRPVDTTLHWGEGKTSASDGQRFSLPRRVLQQTYSTRFSDFALEFYTFIADNYAPFYSLPIECTDRDSGFILDGVRYNESDLALEEHYTDTYGYTEINFATFAMLGLRFRPRIRGAHHQRLYRIDPARDYGAPKSLVGRVDRTIDPAVIAEQWDRMGQLYATLRDGHVTASVALRRLVAYSARNRFYRANRNLGRILKTEFILQYMSEPELRGRIRRGLLKVEQLHALARDVFYGRRGRINARELWEQMNSCSCLTLILACIVYWQAKEISWAIGQGDPAVNGIDLSLLEHVSPIEWDNVVLYGQYILDRKLIRRR
jgi:TnpA family transposase